jgi:hypothetical protein
MALTHLAKERARERSDSAKPVMPGAVTQLFSLSNKPCILKADDRRASYSTALLSDEHLFVRASSLASCKQFSRCAQFIYIKMRRGGNQRNKNMKVIIVICTYQ